MSNDFMLLCPTCRHPYKDWSFTHNLSKMAKVAGIYDVLWHPKETKIFYACQLAPILDHGIRDMNLRREYYRTMDNPNGWGTFDQFFDILKRILNACEEYPHALVEAEI